MLKGRKLILWSRLHVEGVTLTVSTFHPMPIEKVRERKTPPVKKVFLFFFRGGCYIIRRHCSRQ